MMVMMMTIRRVTRKRIWTFKQVVLLLYNEIHSTRIPYEKLQIRFTEGWEIVGLEEFIKICEEKKHLGDLGVDGIIDCYWN